MGQQKWLVEPGQEKTIDVDDIRRLKVGLVSGHVDIIGHDEPNVRIEVHSVSGRDLKVSVEGDTLEIDHPQLRWDNFIEAFRTLRINARADVSVLVPRRIELKLGVVSASAFISGLQSDARLSAVSGDLVVDALKGDLDLNAVSGELSVRDHSGRMTARTVSGDITANGDIPRVITDTVSGDLLLDLTGTPDEIRTKTVSGDLTVRIPEAVGARYRINTVSGRIQVDNGTVSSGAGRNFSGSSGNLDGLWVDIAASSVSGSVAILRRPGATANSTSTNGEGAGTTDSGGTASPSGATPGGAAE
jgi:DUF4097 and DUF4098 domain-containing protein YvlB